MKMVIISIGGMSCSACSNRVEKYLNRHEGVHALVNLVMQNALVYYDEDSYTLDDLGKIIEDSGYQYLGLYDERLENKKDNSYIYFILLLFLIVILMYISITNMFNGPIFSFLDMIEYPIYYGVSLLVLTIPFLIFGFDIIKSGIVKLIHRGPNMDSLVTIGVLSSFIYSFIHLIFIIMGNYDMVHYLYFESCAMIIYFVKLGRYIDKNSKNKTKRAIQELVTITPERALIKDGSKEREVTIDEVRVGDILVCKPGMRVAVDGIVINGSGHFDEAFITGESISKRKVVNDSVIAGSVNLDGYIEYEAKKIGPDSTISSIVRLVVEASNTKSSIQRIVDRVSLYFVPIIIGIAILTFIIHWLFGSSIHDSIISFVTVLVVACPCALGLATPMAMVVSIGSSARCGILIKKSEILELVSHIDTVVFDKTGTLTYGKLVVNKIYNYSKYKDNKLLNIVASLEHNSNHPIALAFVKYYKSNISAGKFNNLVGMGISGKIDGHIYYVGNSRLVNQLNIKNIYKNDEDRLSLEGNTILYVVQDKEIIAMIGVRDIVRDNAFDTILKLKGMNKKVILLSGDNLNTARIIGSELGIDHVVGDVLPQDKEKFLNKLKNEHHKVMMIGDGINDAPSLMSADVGVSISSGTDIAGDSSQVILMNDDISLVVRLFDISNKTIKIIKENLFWAFIYNLLMIPIATGIFKNYISINPMIASFAMTISSLTVVFNSLRLRLLILKEKI